MRRTILLTLIAASSTSPLAGASPIRTVALTGQPAPGIQEGGSFTWLEPPALNSHGQVAFTSGLAGLGVSAGDDTAIWSEGEGVLHAVAREGSVAPGAGTGVVFGDFSAARSDAIPNFFNPNINASGKTAFLSYLKGGDASSANDTSVWSEGGGQLRLVAREGFVPSGMASGPVFRDFQFNYEPIALNDRGNISFWGQTQGAVEDGGRLGIWSDIPGHAIPIAYGSMTIPGASAPNRLASSIDLTTPPSSAGMVTSHLSSGHLPLRGSLAFLS